MRDRVTDRDLDRLCDRINELTGSPMRPWGPDGANVGNYHIGSAYGGVRLERMFNTGGGITTPLRSGYVSRRELYEALSAFIAGLETEY